MAGTSTARQWRLVWGKGASIEDVLSGLHLGRASTDPYRVAAIAAGAVAGVIAVNAGTGGLATPALALGAPAVVAASRSAAARLIGLATTAAGGLAGGYAGGWLSQW